MTDISIGAGFVTPQTAQTTMSILPVQQTAPDTSGGSFMQTLQQNKAVEADLGQSGSAVNGSVSTVSSSDGQTAATGTVSNSPDSTANTGAAASSASESASGTYDASAANEVGTEYETAQKVEYTSSGNVKVDEEAVRELKDLSQKVKDKLTAGEEKPSLLEQAKDALEKAMLKAFKDLNDPEKDKEEFEEKSLIFLMKLVDKITGKTEKKTALTDDEDEDQEKIGGTLLQIIDSMLKNAEENARENPQENGAVGARNDELITNTDFVDIGSSQETARKAIRLHHADLRFEHLPNNPPPPEDYRLPDPNAPVVQGVRTEYTSDSDGSRFDVSSNASIPGIPLTEEAARDGERVIYTDTVTADSTQTVSGNGISAENPVVMTEAHVQTENKVNVGTDKEAQIENPVSVPTMTAEPVGQAAENQTPELFDFGQSEDNGSISYSESELARPEAAVNEETQVYTEETAVYTEERAISQTASEAAAAQSEELSENSVEEGIPNVQARDTSRVNESPTVLRTAEDEEYEKIAQNIYREVTETVKAVAASEIPEKNGEAILRSGGVSEEEKNESEFDELARLFGMKKKEKRPELPEEEEEKAETVRPAKYNETAEKVPVENITAVTSKAADVPIAKVFEPTESGVKQIVTQIVSEIFNNLPEEGGETVLTMTLNPETLGRISVKLVENAGKISVTITAESRETAAILASRAESVQESMRDSGTQLEKYQVVYGAEQDGRAEQQNYDGSSKNPYVREEEEHDDENEGQFAEILGNEAV